MPCRRLRASSAVARPPILPLLSYMFNQISISCPHACIRELSSGGAQLEISHWYMWVAPRAYTEALSHRDCHIGTVT